MVVGLPSNWLWWAACTDLLKEHIHILNDVLAKYLLKNNYFGYVYHTDNE